MASSEIENDEASERRRYSIIVFGASGFTGQFVVEELAKTIDEEKDLTWAVAGRNMAKLQAVLATASDITEKDLSELPIVIADVNDEASLLEMCKQANVILNCVGPYCYYGTSVVKACIEAKTHHIDISGEPGWLEKTHIVFNSKAQESDICILQACGFDSIPAEMGFEHLKREMGGDVNGVESYITLNHGSEGGCGNYGTWLSAIQSFAKQGELKDIRHQLYTSQSEMPRSIYPTPKRSALFHSDYMKKWCIPFMGADRSIVYRSEYFNWLREKKRPVQFKAYYCFPNLLALFASMIVGMIFAILVRFSYGIQLLEKYPKFFSLGMFTKDGPTREQIKGSSFSMTFIGRGYETCIEDATKQHKEPPSKTVVTRCIGPEPGYVTTPICMTQAAFVLLGERDKMPAGGGVLTPGMVFAKTSLLERLEKHGIRFAVIEK